MGVGCGILSSYVILLLTLMALAQAGHPCEAGAVHVVEDIYDDGPYEVKLFKVASGGLWNPSSDFTKKAEKVDRGYRQPPKPLLIAAPRNAGTYPVVVFQHGYMLKNSFYRELMHRVASSGFIVVAAQMYRFFAGLDTTPEICGAGKVIDWLPEGLVHYLAKHVPLVKPDLDKLALAGHSRGGKVVFGLATGVCKTALKYSAIVGLDPVDGFGVERQTKPPIVNSVEHSFNFSFPTLIIGSGLGPQKRNILFPACAPNGVNHRAFYFNSAPLAFHFVASEYGHMDFLDDWTRGVKGISSYLSCKNGPSRAPMRQFSGGIMVAFLRAALIQDTIPFKEALLHPSQAPLKIEDPEFYGSLPNGTSITSLDLQLPHEIFP